MTNWDKRRGGDDFLLHFVKSSQPRTIASIHNYISHFITSQATPTQLFMRYPLGIFDALALIHLTTLNRSAKRRQNDSPEPRKRIESAVNRSISHQGWWTGKGDKRIHWNSLLNLFTFPWCAPGEEGFAQWPIMDSETSNYRSLPVALLSAINRAVVPDDCLHGRWTMMSTGRYSEVKFGC